MGFVFRYAVKCGYIKENPIKTVEARGIDTTTEKATLSFDQLERVAEAIKDDTSMRSEFVRKSVIVSLYLGYFLGTRISETLAITKNDVDLDNLVVSINKKVEKAGKKKEDYYTTDRMKTKSSNSTVPICNTLRDILAEWFEYNPYELVCCDENGEFLSPLRIYRAIYNQVSITGIKFTPHDLRRSYVTNLVRGKTDVKTASQLARHGNIQTTLNIYALMNENDKTRAINSVFNTQEYKPTPKKHPNPDKLTLN